MSEQDYRRAAEILRQSRQATALTGAGISTPSGIPDFRSPGGLWSQVDPEQVASISAFQRNPLGFYDWFTSPQVDVTKARPNPAHYALAELEQKGILRTVITQNIDGLHQKAGSGHVLELHGRSGTASCLRCGKGFDGTNLLERFRQTQEVPHCDCGGLIKPDVVLFGENLPLHTLQKAHQEVAQCDLLIVVGSSLTVVPAAQIPWLAVQAGAALVICNLTETWADPYAQAILREDVATSLPALLQLLEA